MESTGRELDFYAKRFNELTPTEVYEIMKARQKVFVVEQKIICVDADDIDYRSLHCFFMRNGIVEAYLRAFYDDVRPATVTIGRVLTITRGKGIGRQLMERAIAEIKRQLPCSTIRMDAQKQAQSFYEKIGFKTVSGEYLEEGVVHVDMEMTL